MPADLNLYSPTGPELRPEWSMRLVMDVALGTSTESILEAHELQFHQFEHICSNPQFVARVEELKKNLEKEGASFRLKSQLQADFYLAKVHEMIMDPETDQRVATRLIEDVVRWGGLDSAPAVGDSRVGGFGITINFGANPTRGITIENEA